MTNTPSVVFLALCSTALFQAAHAQAPVESRPHSTELAPAVMTTQESMRMRPLADAFMVLSQQGIELVNARRLMRIDQIEQMQKDALLNGATSSRFMQIKGETGIIIAWRFDEERALEVNARLRPDAIVYENELLMPEDCSPDTWVRIRTLLGQSAATDEQYQHDGAKAASALLTLQTVRQRINEYHNVHGRWPDFERHGWSQLIEDGWLTSAPINPASTYADQTRVVVITSGPGEASTGRSVPADQGAWVWNATTAVLFVAGHDDHTLVQRVREYHQLVAELRNIQLDAAKEGPTWLKEFAINAEVDRMRLAIASHYTTMSLLGSPSFPTFTAVREAEGVIVPVGPNPQNGSSEIQMARWDAENPPVQGTAGWNYDPDTGKFWANSPTNIGYPE